jgi:uncharacterized protein GlcG (DUF336 family)
MMKRLCVTVCVAMCFLALNLTCLAQSENGDSSNYRERNACASLPDQSALKGALIIATQTEESGLNNQMWAAIVDRDGVVCAVAFSGVNRGAQWPGSRLISAQKANTANAFSLDNSSNSGGSGQPGGLALSTANLYSATQPGGSLFGLQASNPVNVEAAYRGPSSAYGTNSDPLVGHKIGGVNVFGGGLALYALGHVIVGGVGVSGDTSCADHNISWRVRHILNLDQMGIYLTKVTTIPCVCSRLHSRKSSARRLNAEVEKRYAEAESSKALFLWRRLPRRS